MCLNEKFVTRTAPCGSLITVCGNCTVPVNCNCVDKAECPLLHDQCEGCSNYQEGNKTMTTEELKLIYQARYSIVEGSTLPCRAIVSLAIPADKNGYILPVFRGQRKALEETLTASWGKDTGNSYRTRELELGATNWDDLVEDVRDTKKECLENIRKVVNDNLVLTRLKPDDSVEEVML